MRYAVGLEYDGSGFYGWQVQVQEPTVQGALEKALSKVANEFIRVSCCGRTDTGVHAWGQVAHFDTDVKRPDHSWVLGANRYLPAGISLLWIKEVDPDFHARFSAISRSYRYCILNRRIRPAIDVNRKAWCSEPLNENLMNQAAQALAGVHDFSSFRAAACQSHHAVRDIKNIQVSRKLDKVTLDITANGFLYHMVRNIAGSLIAIGRGDRSVEWLSEVLELQDRTKAASTASAVGLYFMSARYPSHYELPDEGHSFVFQGDPS